VLIMLRGRDDLAEPGRKPPSCRPAKLSARNASRSPANDPVCRSGTTTRAWRASASATTAPFDGHQR
jgi:hypothetical protein